MARSIYGVHPGVTMVQTAIAKLPEKTGRSLDQWIALLIDTSGFEKGDRITHRIAITAPGDIDGDVTRWMTNAYELDM